MRSIFPLEKVKNTFFYFEWLPKKRKYLRLRNPRLTEIYRNSLCKGTRLTDWLLTGYKALFSLGEYWTKNVSEAARLVGCFTNLRTILSKSFLPPCCSPNNWLHPPGNNRPELPLTVESSSWGCTLHATLPGLIMTADSRKLLFKRSAGSRQWTTCNNSPVV